MTLKNILSRFRKKAAEAPTTEALIANITNTVRALEEVSDREEALRFAKTAQAEVALEEADAAAKRSDEAALIAGRLAALVELR